MWFSRYLPPGQLAQFCRSVRYSLEAGISPKKIFRQQSELGPIQVRLISKQMESRLEQGDRLRDALAKEKSFPPLFVQMVGVGERTGYLPEVLSSLEHYYQTQQTLTRQFFSQILLPVLQFTFAVLIVAFVIWIFGVIGGTSENSLSLFGLRGTSGALIFLGSVVGTLVFLFVGYRLLSRLLKGKELVDKMLLGIPMFGPCMRALAMSRFTLAMQLTMDSGMSIHKGVAMSLAATGNAAFAAMTNRVKKYLKAGEDLTAALTSTRLFSQEFCLMVAVAEESGSVPEVMRKQSQYFQEETERKLKQLAQSAAWGVWLVYAVFAIVMIFQLAGIYFNALSI